MNKLGNSLVLSDTAGLIANNSTAEVLGVCIKSALVGSLTITGVSNTDGSAASWVISSGTSGYVAAPGSGLSWGNLQYALSSGSDASKAIAMFVPR